MKKRAKILDECVGAVRACWNHYNNYPISDECLVRVRAMMEDDFPLAFTSEWEKVSREYLAYVKSEAD